MRQLQWPVQWSVAICQYQRSGCPMPALSEAESSRSIRRTWEFRLREVFTRRIPFLLELLHTSLAQSFVSPQADRVGIKLSYCTDEIPPASSNITLYIVGG